MKKSGGLEKPRHPLASCFYYFVKIQEQKGILLAGLFYYSVLLLFGILLSILCTNFLPKWLYLLFYPSSKFLSGSNPLLTFIQNIVAIFGLIAMIYGLRKKVKDLVFKMFKRSDPST